MKQYSDIELIDHYLKGDEKSLELLIQRYLKPIFGFVLGYVRDKDIAEDITQETFLKVFRNIKKVDRTKNIKSWIYTIAKNTAFDTIKKKKSIPFSSFQTEEGKNYLAESLPSRGPLPDHIAESQESRRNFLKAIGMLSEKYKTVLTLYYYQHLNFREIAQFLASPINTIKSRHRRGLGMLKEIIKAQ